MKFSAIVSALATAALVSAQNANIFAPASGDTLYAGQDFVITVTKPNSLSGSTEVGIALALHQCGDSACDTSGDVLGEVLYAGAWDPVYGQSDEAGGVPYQNFTATVPSAYSGDATLFLVHTNLIGAGPEVYNQLVTTQVTIAASD